MIDINEYYDLHDLLSRGAMFNFAVGSRGDGKTFSGKNRGIINAIKRHEQFIYLRRYETEIKDSKARFFDDVAGQFPEHEFSVNGGEGRIRKVGEKDWDTCCYFVALSNALTKKSVSYSRVTLIIFDEFIIDKGFIRYLTDEVKCFLDFYNTVDRWQDKTRVLFFANAVSLVNPYFVYFGVTEQQAEFARYRKGYVCVQFINDAAFRRSASKSKFGQMIQGTAYEDYALHNEFSDSGEEFIRGKTAQAYFGYALVFNSRRFGVWCDAQNGDYYITNKIPSGTENVFCLSKSDMRPNLVMVDRTAPILKALKKLYMQGCVYFDSVKTRGLFEELLRFLSL